MSDPRWVLVDRQRLLVGFCERIVEFWVTPLGVYQQGIDLVRKRLQHVDVPAVTERVLALHFGSAEEWFLNVCLIWRDEGFYY